MKNKKKLIKTKKTISPPMTDAAYSYFGLKTDPFTTLALQKHNLDYFIGREALISRLLSAMFSVSNVGVAGEPGVGKSSLMQLLKSRVPSKFHHVSIGVPLDDATYFLSELLREMLVVIPPVAGLNFKDIGRKLESGELSKNAVFSNIRSIVSRLKKPLLVFVDDLEKIKSDRVQHLTRSERTLQLLEELKALLELPNVGFIMALQEEFYAKVSQVVKEGAEPTVLGLFKNVVLVEKFGQRELKEILFLRLKQAGFKREWDSFLEPEALTLALSISSGNPRRFMYLLSEAMYRGFQRKSKRVEFQDLFEAVNEHLKLDLVCKKLLYFLAKSGRAVASNTDLQAFMGLDMISIVRRLEILSKNRLAETVDVVDGTKVYALPGFKETAPTAATYAQVRMTQSATGERMFNLLNEKGQEQP
ncbi:MAG TPA: ATP-binding protein [bacterium]|nr:ATP-binding protein [bacterium]